ncbi:MAG: TetR family transcriptional regulator [Deltaproteobacteria bacterium]|nr:TetR family transcriptional regulator [Deltaproteobacteria bacterium]
MTVHSSEPGRAGAGDKRDRILDAAERIFAEHGFFASRVAEIAREAGVADGTIYLYFKNKDDLLISLFESRMERVNDLLARTLAQHEPVDRLKVFIHTYLGLVRDQPAAAEVLTVELRQSSKFMKQYANPRFGEFLRMLAGVVADGQAAGQLDATIPAPVAARMIFGLLDEMALAWLLSDKTTDTSPQSRDKKFDIVRAADWVGALITQGLERRS